MQVAPASPQVARPRAAVAYWAAAVIVYAALGVLVPPVFLLGFWQSLPFVLVATLIASRLLPRPVAPLPPAPPE